jgi:hypothetical protein
MTLNSYKTVSDIINEELYYFVKTLSLIDTSYDVLQTTINDKIRKEEVKMVGQNPIRVGK